MVTEKRSWLEHFQVDPEKGNGRADMSYTLKVQNEIVIALRAILSGDHGSADEGDEGDVEQQGGPMEVVKAMRVVKSAADGELKAMRTMFARRPKVYHLSSDSDDWG